jgi:AcrR family transcriptional regulator
VRLRDQHAAVTREAILRAARELFAEFGFARTSIKQLAARAGVAVQTIYDTFGSKADVLMAMADLIDEEAGVLELAATIAKTDDPRELVRLFARIRRQIRERCSDLVQMLREGAAVEPAAAAAWAEGRRRRHEGLGRVMQRLQARGALKAGLSAPRAADVAAALVVDEACDVLVEQRGWTYDEYEAWLAEALAALVLR